MKLRLFFAALYLIPLSGFCQTHNVVLLNWINDHSLDIRHSDGHIQVLEKELESRSVLALGEASHGTREFFLEKNRIINYLVKNPHFRMIGFEFNDKMIQPVNRFINNGEGDLISLMRDFRLYNTREFFDLFTSLKNFNSSLKPEDKIQIYGFDDDYDYPDRDSLMAHNVLKKLTETGQKVIIWGHDVHLAKDKTAGFEGMGGFLSKAIGSNYFNVAFDTFSGTVTNLNYENSSWNFSVNPLPTPQNNFPALFKLTTVPDFYIGFPPGSPFYGSVNNKTHIFADRRAPFEIPTALGKSFDAFIFIRETIASELIPAN